MRNMLKKATGLILSAALTFSLAAPAKFQRGGRPRPRHHRHPV